MRYFAAFVLCETLLFVVGDHALGAHVLNVLFWTLAFLLRSSWRVLFLYGLGVMSYPLGILVIPDLDFAQQTVLMEQFGYIASGIIGFAIFEAIFLRGWKLNQAPTENRIVINSSGTNKIVLTAVMLLVLATILTGGLLGLFELGGERVVLPLRLDIPMLLLVNYAFFPLFYFFILRVALSNDLRYPERISFYIVMLAMVISIFFLRESKGFLISVFLLILVANMSFHIFPSLRWHRVIMIFPFLLLVYGIMTFLRQGYPIELAFKLLFSGTEEIYQYLAFQFYNRVFGSAGDVLRLFDARPDIYMEGAFAEVVEFGGAPRFNTEHIVAINTDKAYSAGTAGLADVVFYFGHSAPMYFVFVQMLAPLVVGSIASSFLKVDKKILQPYLDYWWITFILFGGLTNLMFPLFLFAQIVPLSLFRLSRINDVQPFVHLPRSIWYQELRKC